MVLNIVKTGSVASGAYLGFRLPENSFIKSIQGVTTDGTAAVQSTLVAILCNSDQDLTAPAGMIAISNVHEKIEVNQVVPFPYLLVQQTSGGAGVAGVHVVMEKLPYYVREAVSSAKGV